MKSFEIRKRLVYEAWQPVRANGGAPGVDAVNIERFEADEDNNLYKTVRMTHIASDAYSSQLAENALGRGVSP